MVVVVTCTTARLSLESVFFFFKLLVVSDSLNYLGLCYVGKAIQVFNSLYV